MRELLVLGNIILVPYLHDNGYMRAEMGVRDANTQVFSYQRRTEQGEPIGDMIHVDVGKLRRQIAAGTREEYPRKLYSVNGPQAEFIIKHSGIEMEHLNRMHDAEAVLPGIILLWNDGQETIVDGNHRFVKRWQLGREHMWFSLVTEEQIKPCLLAFPDELAPIEARESSGQN